MNHSHVRSRREFLRETAVLASAFVATRISRGAEEEGFRPLFDGKTLQGWHAVPRLPIPKSLIDERVPSDKLKERVLAWAAENPGLRQAAAHTGRWGVQDGVLSGGQEPPGSGRGAYLLSDNKFGDFELELEARPDWPIDTGIMVRTHELGSIGFQVLLDHRPKGGIGGFYGNNTGGFLSAPFVVDGDEQQDFRVANLRPGAREPNLVKATLSYGTTFEEFVRVWRLNDWNQFRIRCVGLMPVITTWINGLKISALDTAKLDIPGYDAEAIFERLGRTGHIGFEVHDNGKMGHDRWAPGAVCRWREIRIKTL
jgi:Domain of Unknown Function (DUF1080)